MEFSVFIILVSIAVSRIANSVTQPNVKYGNTYALYCLLKRSLWPDRVSGSKAVGKEARGYICPAFSFMYIHVYFMYMYINCTYQHVVPSSA